MGVKKFIWDELSDNVLLETDENDMVTAAYTNRPERFGELLSQHRSGVDRFFHFDGKHSTSDLTASNEKVTDTFSFTAYGEEVARTGTTTTPFGFKGAVGYYTNSETGDIYVRARTYQPAIGCWQSMDPLGFVDGTNLYRAYFVPVNADPSGLVTRFNYQPFGTSQCGMEEGVTFQFKPDKKYNNYRIIQRMEVYCDIRDCRVSKPGGSPFDVAECDCLLDCPRVKTGSPPFVFYESFEGGKNDVDQWSRFYSQKKCGVETRIAEAKVAIPPIPKHIDQLFDFNKEIGPRDCRFGFDEKFKQPTAIETSALANWWLTLKSETSSSLYAIWTFNCCSHCKNHADFVYAPYPPVPTYPGDGLPPR